MNAQIQAFLELLQSDQRYKPEAYNFVREALAYAQDVLGMTGDAAPEDETARHLTGQQLCEAIRLFAQEQYGFLAQVVLNNWGIHSTGDFGEIVYNLIRIGHMKKSSSDRREDFDDCYDFQSAFEPIFHLASSE